MFFLHGIELKDEENRRKRKLNEKKGEEGEAGTTARRWERKCWEEWRSTYKLERAQSVSQECLHWSGCGVLSVAVALRWPPPE